MDEGTLNMMNSALQMTNSAFQMMNSALQMMRLRFQMMYFGSILPYLQLAVTAPAPAGCALIRDVRCCKNHFCIQRRSGLDRVKFYTCRRLIDLDDV